jgi:hypothetical protein
MIRTAASIAILALGLAACASQAPRQEPRIATQEMPYHAGQGVVAAVMPAPAPVRAAAGGTVAAASTTPMPYRLAIRMDNGTMQYVDTDNADIRAGARVTLGEDHTIRLY